KLFKIDKVKGIFLLDKVIIGFISKCKRKHTLFLKVCFVYTCKRFYKNRPYAKVPRLHCSMLTRRSLAIVMVAHNKRRYPCSFVSTGCSRHCIILASYLVKHVIRFHVISVYSAYKHVV